MTKTPKRNRPNKERTARIAAIAAHFGYSSTLLERKTDLALYRMWSRIDTPEVQGWLNVHEPKPVEPTQQGPTRRWCDLPTKWRMGHNGRGHWTC